MPTRINQISGSIINIREAIETLWIRWIGNYAIRLQKSVDIRRILTRQGMRIIAYAPLLAAIGPRYDSSNASICSSDSHTNNIGLKA